MVRQGEVIEHKKVRLEIVEVMPQFDPAGRPTYMVSYRLRDGNYTSPVAHFWMKKSDDVRKPVAEVVEYYLSIISSLRGAPP